MIITYFGMDELLNSTGGEPAKKAWTVAVPWHALKGLDLITSVEEKLDTFSI